MADDVKELATEVLAVLDLQQDYFKSKNGESLTRSKAAERALRKRCKDIVDDRKPEPSLFDPGT